MPNNTHQDSDNTTQAPKEWHIFFLLLLLASTFLIYFPGLYGELILDDEVNLRGLEAIKGLSDWEGIFAFTMNGISSTLGRPLSLLSFALQYHDWPDNPFNFKLVNLLIHLTNGALIYFISSLIVKQIPSVRINPKTFALAIAAIWLLHPLQVSTALYIIQRMAQLSVMFTLLGILIYLRARINIPSEQSKKSLIGMSAGVVVGLLFGILSKETAILICLYILVIEWTVLSHVVRPKHWKLWAGIFTVVPLVSLVIYLSPLIYEHLFAIYPYRNFTALERLYTEFRVILDYMSAISFPRPNHFGLFHTDYVISKSLFNPISTFMAFTLLLALLATAIKIRKRFPLISFGLLFYFAGHMLESNLINLELYFEHRNYLPIMGIIIAGTATIYELFVRLKARHFNLAAYSLFFAFIVWSLFIAVITHNEIKLWANPLYQAATWAEAHPSSHRATSNFSSQLVHHGRIEEAKELFKKNSQLPDQLNDPGYPMLWLELQCGKGTLEPPPQDVLLQRLETGKYSRVVDMILDSILRIKSEGRCGGVDNPLLLKVLQAVAKNSAYQTDVTQKSLHIFFAKYYLVINDEKMAVQHLGSAFAMKPSPDILLSVASIHFESQNWRWYLQSVEMLNQYCSEHRISCLIYRGPIDEHTQMASTIEQQIKE